MTSPILPGFLQTSRQIGVEKHPNLYDNKKLRKAYAEITCDIILSIIMKREPSPDTGEGVMPPFHKSKLLSTSMSEGSIGVNKSLHVCKFFSGSGICANGDYCKYQHIESADRSASTKLVICKFFDSFRGCKSGESCPFVHLKDCSNKTEQKLLSKETHTAQGREILLKYSMSKAAEDRGLDAFIRK